ncbi:hypothetical protein [Zoogloea sp.]|uniref:hypothetical protein n=1 Tax=Zoogloea sp. TaxID=49181 RepID=UPI0014156CA3|nr:MAG: hypothetical protein F9K15_24705 [Zoogloea sp.]
MTMLKIWVTMLICVVSLYGQGNPRTDFPGLKAQYYNADGGIIKWYYDNTLPNNTTKLGGDAEAARSEIREEIANAMEIWRSFISSEYYPNNLSVQEGDEGAHIIISFADMGQATELGNTKPEDGDVVNTGVRSLINMVDSSF